jgi:Zn-dependent protease with chaperone function
VGRWLLVLVSLATAARADEPPVDTIEAGFTAELHAIAPIAVPAWEEANQARAEGRWSDAEAGYVAVLEDAPEFDHALRRLCSALQAEQQLDAAESRCRAALAIRDSGYNHFALADVLLDRDENARAHDELDRADATGQIDDLTMVATRCRLEMSEADWTGLERSARRWIELAPDDWRSHFALGVAYSQYDESATIAEFRTSRRLGMPDELYEPMAPALAVPPEEMLAWLALYGGLPTLGLWMALWAGLAAAGLGFSAAASRTARDMLAEPGQDVHINPGMRRVYRWVMQALCLAYYVSLPVVALLALLLGVGLFLLALGLRRIWPFPLIAAFQTVGAVGSAAFARVEGGDPGERIDLRNNPKLRKVLNDVARQVGTTPVDEVFAVPDATMAVTERSGVAGQMFGRSKRALILGVGALDGMSTGAFKAILAHEYGHFAHGDTAGGEFALGVRVSLMRLAEGLARRGLAAYYNPVWAFLDGFHRLFVRVSAGAGRLQELHADRVSARLYGGEPFVEGLTHVIGASVRFDAHVNATVSEVVRARRPLANLYSYRPDARPDPGPLLLTIAGRLERNTNPWDSHPAPRERFAWVRATGTRNPAPEADAGLPAWDLVDEREGLERAMTERIRSAIAINHRVQIPR